MLMKNTKTVQAPNVVTLLMPLDKNRSTKRFKLDENGKMYTKDSAITATNHKGLTQPVDDLRDFYEIMKDNQEANCYMILGGIIDGTDTNNMRRISENTKTTETPTIEDRPVHIFYFDVDGYDDPNPSKFIKNELPEEFHNAECTLHYSSSHGVKPGLRCHLFFWLEEPAMISDIWRWISNSGIKGLDKNVAHPSQPIFTQARICEGFEDPFPNSKKWQFRPGEKLNWSPPKISKSQAKLNSKGKNDFDWGRAVRDLMSASDYHGAINSIALSLANDKIPSYKVKQLLKAEMERHPLKDDRWQARYDDIDRSVDSAYDIVNEMPIEDFLDWVDTTATNEVEANFANKCIHYNAFEMTAAVNAISKKTGYGIRDVKSMVNDAKKDHASQMAELVREQQLKQWEAEGKTVITYKYDNKGGAIRSICKALTDSTNGDPIFKHGAGLVCVRKDFPKTIRQCCSLDEMEDAKDYPEMPIIHLYSKPYYDLEKRMEQDIIMIDEAGKMLQGIPTMILHNVGYGKEENLKPLSGIVEHPYIDGNWEIKDENGYDPATGLYAVLHRKLKIKLVDPKKAYKYLTDVVFDEFPFASELDKAVAVAAMMTAIQKPTISGNSGLPGFGIVSPTQSSGKTTLAQIISHAVYNREVGAASWTDDDVELCKHLLGILQEGQPCVLFDNIKQGSKVSSNTLASAMTNDVFTGRQLGTHEIIKVPASCIWFFTGNGIMFVGDFATRIYPINIDPLMETPDNRIFKRKDLYKWVMDNRKHILSALLSIVVAGEGLPEMPTSTRFKEWDVFVRRPLFAVSGIDVNEAIRINQRDDVDAQAKKEIVRCLYEQFGEKQFTTRDVIKAAFGAFEAGETDLGCALNDVMDRKRAQSTNSVGIYFGTLVNVVLGDFKLIKKISNVVKWQVAKLK